MAENKTFTQQIAELSYSELKIIKDMAVKQIKDKTAKGEDTSELQEKLAVIMAAISERDKKKGLAKPLHVPRPLSGATYDAPGDGEER